MGIRAKDWDSVAKKEKIEASPSFPILIYDYNNLKKHM